MSSDLIPPSAAAPAGNPAGGAGGQDSAGPTPATLHGVTLSAILEALVACHGWEELGRRIPIGCFNSSPSIRSSLTFLRKTPWAREKVEQLYLRLPR